MTKKQPIRVENKENSLKMLSKYCQVPLCILLIISVLRRQVCQAWALQKCQALALQNIFINNWISTT